MLLIMSNFDLECTFTLPPCKPCLQEIYTRRFLKILKSDLCSSKIKMLPHWLVVTPAEGNVQTIFGFLRSFVRELIRACVHATDRWIGL